jgi:hypothetical protein
MLPIIGHHRSENDVVMQLMNHEILIKLIYVQLFSTDLQVSIDPNW